MRACSMVRETPGGCSPKVVLPQPVTMCGGQGQLLTAWRVPCTMTGNTTEASRWWLDWVGQGLVGWRGLKKHPCKGGQGRGNWWLWNSTADRWWGSREEKDGGHSFRGESGHCGPWGGKEQVHAGSPGKAIEQGKETQPPCKWGRTLLWGGWGSLGERVHSWWMSQGKICEVGFL